MANPLGHDNRLTLIGADTGADRRVEIVEFLHVTGFDQALDSIAHSADSASDILGLDPKDYGDSWGVLTETLFSPEALRGMAIDILSETLPQSALSYSQEFYASTLGQRLVQAENNAHEIIDAEVTEAAGGRILLELVENGDPKLEIFQRMNDAIGSADEVLRASQEIHVRLLMAGQAAGLIELRVDEEGLRDLLSAQDDDLRVSLQQTGLATAAYTYQGFTTEELEAYTRALEDPRMRETYELLNAVQYEIQANRFEALAYGLAALQPAQDL